MATEKAAGRKRAAGKAEKELPGERFTPAEANSALRARYEAARKEFADGGTYSSSPRVAATLCRKLSERYRSLYVSLVFEAGMSAVRLEPKEPQKFGEGRAFVTRADLEAALAGVAPSFAEVVAYAAGYEAAWGDAEHERKVRDQERADREYEACGRVPIFRVLGPGFFGPFGPQCG